MQTVIFACVHNAGRSQMAAAYFNALADPTKARAVSAGTNPAERVHPEVVTVMREVGLDLTGARPQRLTPQLAQGATLLVTMGCGDDCPYVPGLLRDDWPLEDPKGRSLHEVRVIREAVRARVEKLVSARRWMRPELIGVPRATTTQKDSVLFLCTANSARSQMAEALLRRRASDRFAVYSAGLEPRDVHPLTHRVLRELGIDTSGLRSKGTDEFLGKARICYAIIVCDKAADSCPRIFPFATHTLYWPFEDPAAIKGSEEERLGKFREVRDEIDSRIQDWVSELGGGDV